MVSHTGITRIIQKVEKVDQCTKIVDLGIKKDYFILISDAEMLNLQLMMMEHLIPHTLKI